MRGSISCKDAFQSQLSWIVFLTLAIQLSTASRVENNPAQTKTLKTNETSPRNRVRVFCKNFEVNVDRNRKGVSSVRLSMANLVENNPTQTETLKTNEVSPRDRVRVFCKVLTYTQTEKGCRQMSPGGWGKPLRTGVTECARVGGYRKVCMTKIQPWMMEDMSKLTNAARCQQKNRVRK